MTFRSYISILRSRRRWRHEGFPIGKRNSVSRSGGERRTRWVSHKLLYLETISWFSPSKKSRLLTIPARGIPYRHNTSNNSRLRNRNSSFVHLRRFPCRMRSVARFAACIVQSLTRFCPGKQNYSWRGRGRKRHIFVGEESSRKYRKQGGPELTARCDKSERALLS